MPKYVYKCIKKGCSKFDKEVEVSKSMSESSSKEECSECRLAMDRVYKPFSAQTADGFKR